jgi:sporulation related protein
MAQTTRGATRRSVRDPKEMMRLGAWASLACIAVLLAIIMAQTETGLRRIAGAFGTDPATRSTSPQLAIRPFDPEVEARRLNEAVRVLAADRDRLLARIGTLERNLDATGSIPPVAPTATPASPPPVVSAPETTATAAPPPARPATGAAPPMASERLSAAHSATANASESVATRTEFGIDLGTSATIEGLRTQWATLKSKQPALFEGLRPIVAVRDGAKGLELRLIAGPLANAGAAARLCAALSAGGLTCQPAVFDGQRLALQ